MLDKWALTPVLFTFFFFPMFASNRDHSVQKLYGNNPNSRELNAKPLQFFAFGASDKVQELNASKSQEFAAKTTSLESDSSGHFSKTEKEKIKPILEGKLGYFFFSDSKMRKIYNDGGLDAQISGSYPLWKWLQLYGSVEYVSKHGKSSGLAQKTRIWEVPLSLGLKPVFKISRQIQYYFTLGPRYIFTHVHNNSHFVDRELNANGWAGFVNTGFNISPTSHFCIDVFGEYSYSRVHFHSHKKNVFGNTVQIGGLTFGGGLGYAF